MVTEWSRMIRKEKGTKSSHKLQNYKKQKQKLQHIRTLQYIAKKKRLPYVSPLHSLPTKQKQTKK